MYIVTGPITSAIRLSRAVERFTGTPAAVIHTPSQMNKGGCSYTVKTDMTDTEALRKIAADNGVTIKGIYGEKTSGKGREYYDIS